MKIMLYIKNLIPIMLILWNFCLTLILRLENILNALLIVLSIVLTIIEIIKETKKIVPLLKKKIK